ncbi:WD repeat-containing protein 91 isoform X2 [Cimex lectularius]|uniref:WD repeat-containing protein 91 n=1 Tax=Cimex lectularius TaxID=79782 RepID=A0A8I6SQD4_CIMLE|nr:WD repeat-containing protein 91 isoform X2 [Cimex lectularius]
MSHFTHLDDLVREYLLFRGFTITLKSFDAELKVDKDRGFRVDKIVDQFLLLINNCDLNSLRALWSHFDQKIFSKLDHEFTPGLRKLEISLHKYYLVNAISSKNPDKVNEFFTKMTPELQGQPEWKEWFMLPYIEKPEEHGAFAVHFTKQWQDTFLVSLHNFLAIIYQVMPQPALSSYEEEATKLRRLQEENDALKHKLATLSQCANIVPEVVPPMDIMDDFYIIAQENPASNNENHPKSLKNLIRTIGGGIPTSPIMGRKPQPQDDQFGVKKHHSSKRHVSQGGWIKQSRSLSLDSRPRRSNRDVSVENVDKRGNRKDTFLLLSQEKMTEHKAAVTQCKFNALGNMIASCDSDGIIKLWSAESQIKVHSTLEYKSGFTSLSWLTKNERYFVSGSQDGILRLHDSRENKTIWETGNEDSSPLTNTKILSLCCSPTECSVACSAINFNKMTGKLLFYDIKTKKVEQSFTLGNGTTSLSANCCQFNHNGSLLIVGCSDGSVRALDLRNGECVESWGAHEGCVSTIHITPDHNFCYTLGADHKLNKHNLAHNGEATFRVTLPNCQTSHGTQGFTLHQNGKLVLTACGNIGANIYQVTDSCLQAMLSLEGHKSPLTTCDWSTANQCSTCLSSSADGKINVSTILTP